MSIRTPKGLVLVDTDERLEGDDPGAERDPKRTRAGTFGPGNSAAKGHHRKLSKFEVARADPVLRGYTAREQGAFKKRVAEVEGIFGTLPHAARSLFEDARDARRDSRFVRARGLRLSDPQLIALAGALAKTAAELESRAWSTCVAHTDPDVLVRRRTPADARPRIEVVYTDSASAAPLGAEDAAIVHAHALVRETFGKVTRPLPNGVEARMVRGESDTEMQPNEAARRVREAFKPKDTP